MIDTVRIYVRNRNQDAYAVCLAQTLASTAQWCSLTFSGTAPSSPAQASCYQNWETEVTLGTILADHPELRENLSIHSKANAGQKPHCCLSTESVLYQCRESLKRLQVASLDIYYLHSPDFKTDVDQALAAIDELHKAGEIKEFGLSNYPAWKVTDIYHRCKVSDRFAHTV